MKETGKQEGEIFQGKPLCNSFWNAEILGKFVKRERRTLISECRLKEAILSAIIKKPYLAPSREFTSQRLIFRLS
jgi:hypothetical protein